MWLWLIIYLLLAVISGFVAWVIDTRVNAAEFPGPFLIGLFEDFWWRFISMTAVGFMEVNHQNHVQVEHLQFCGLYLE